MREGGQRGGGGGVRSWKRGPEGGGGRGQGEEENLGGEGGHGGRDGALLVVHPGAVQDGVCHGEVTAVIVKARLHHRSSLAPHPVAERSDAGDSAQSERHHAGHLGRLREVPVTELKERLWMVG